MIAMYITNATNEAHGVWENAVPSAVLTIKSTLARNKLLGENLHFSKMTELQNMYVTTKDIDDVINRVSFTISEAINIALEK